MPEAGVLFVGEYPALSASLARVLKSLGCECRYANSRQEASAAIERRNFRIVLSKAKLADGNPRALIPAMRAASGWLFLSFPVEDGCWWIPVMENGELCLEAVALRSRDFSKSLLRIVNGILPPPEAEKETSALRMEAPRRAAYATGSY